MTIVVNMLFRQIVRENAIPLSMPLNSITDFLDDLTLAKIKRQNGYRGRVFKDAITEMEQIDEE